MSREMTRGASSSAFSVPLLVTGGVATEDMDDLGLSGFVLNMCILLSFVIPIIFPLIFLPPVHTLINE